MFASAFLASCCQGNTEERTHSCYMSPLSRKEHDSTWIKERLCSRSLLQAVGHHRLQVESHTCQGRDSLPWWAEPAQSLEKGLGSSLLLLRPRWWLWGGQSTLKGWKAHGKKWTRRENCAKWKVTKFKWGGAVPAFLPGHCLDIVLSVYGALYSGIMQQPPKTSLLLQNLGMDL